MVPALKAVFIQNLHTFSKLDSLELQLIIESVSLLTCFQNVYICIDLVIYI